ncbi:nucleoside triphosphate pyrophosphohydrolase [Thermophagus sp. OGC60D27]|uniref:nucleoside triphosphate pyrophosphohydrolase n=1 Tax=Thermophagus sp. OGC60D27 TaxID=3458415 RepID=UPI004038302A
MSLQEKKEAFGKLLEVMDQLREQCPWDRQQTNESLRTQTIEETYELAEAIIKDSKEAIRKELGDLLLHIVFYSKIGEEKHAFTIKDVIDTLIEKLIYRHPHIFGNKAVKDAQEVEQNWERLKLKEKDGNRSVLAGVPNSLPAMVKANRIQEKTRGVGFDWEHREQVWDKVQEELSEVKAEIAHGSPDSIEDEFGDLLFSIINAARLYGVNPENALERTNQKFIKRFNYLEQKTIKQGVDLKDLSLDEMNKIWEEAKKL